MAGILGRPIPVVSFSFKNKPKQNDGGIEEEVQNEETDEEN